MVSIHRDGLEVQSYIVYSISYQVPVLFFLPMITSENLTKFATIDQIKDYLSSDDPGSISLSVSTLITFTYVNSLLLYLFYDLGKPIK